MIEKLIENWLNSINERGYMPAFCQLLSLEGYHLIYISPHGVHEQGKDIIARNPKGELEAFQLKCGDVDTNVWRKYIGELEELVKLPIKHPNVPKNTPYKSWLITNGEIKDNARVNITDMNSVNWHLNSPTNLYFRDKTSLLSDFVNHYKDFFPKDTKDFNRFLEIYISDGFDFFPKKLYVEFLESILEIDKDTLSANSAKANVASALLMTSYLLFPWTKNKNSIPQIEAWTVLLSYIKLIAHKYTLAEENFENSTLIISTAIEDAFKELLSEVKGRKNLIAGDMQTDSLVYNYRTPVVIGFLCTYALYSKLKYGKDLDDVNDILKILEKYWDRMKFAGESYTPLFLYYLLFLDKYGIQSSDKFKGTLYALIALLTKKEQLPVEYGFPSPYYDYEESLRIILGFTFEEHEEYFVGQSHSLELLVNLLARRDMKEILLALWRPITHTQYVNFEYVNEYDIFKWRCSEGTKVTAFPLQTESWKRLSAAAKVLDENTTYRILNKDADFGLLLGLVFPHRMTERLFRIIDSSLNPHLFETSK